MPTKQQISGALNEIARGLSNYANIRFRQEEGKKRLEEDRRKSDKAFDVKLKEKELSRELEDRRRRERKEDIFRTGEEKIRTKQEKIELEERTRRDKKTTKLTSPAGLKHIWMTNPNDPRVPANYKKAFQAEFDKTVGKGTKTGAEAGRIDPNDPETLILKEWFKMDATGKADFGDNFNKFKETILNQMLGQGFDQIGAGIDANQQFNVGDQQRQGDVRIGGQDFPLDQTIGGQGEGQPINPNLLPGGLDARTIPEDVYNRSTAGLFSSPGEQPGAPQDEGTVSQPDEISGQPEPGEEDAIDITAEVDPNYLKPEEEEIDLLLDKLNMGTISPEEEQRLSELVEQLGQ